MEHGPVNIYPLLWIIGGVLSMYPVGKFGRWVDIKMGQSSHNDLCEYIGVGYLFILMIICMIGLTTTCLVGLYDLIFYGVKW